MVTRILPTDIIIDICIYSSDDICEILKLLKSFIGEKCSNYLIYIRDKLYERESDPILLQNIKTKMYDWFFKTNKLEYMDFMIGKGFVVPDYSYQFFRYCYDNNLTYAKHLVQSKENRYCRINDIHYLEYGAFCRSIYDGHYEVAKYLIELGERYHNPIGQHYITEVFHCCEYSNFKIVKLLVELIKRYNILIDRSNFEEVFNGQCYYGNIKTIKYLINYAESINSPIDIHAHNDVAILNSCSNELSSYTILKYFIWLGENGYKTEGSENAEHFYGRFDIHTGNERLFWCSFTHDNVKIMKYLIELGENGYGRINTDMINNVDYKSLPQHIKVSEDNSFIKSVKYLIKLGEKKGYTQFSSSSVVDTQYFSSLCKDRSLGTVKCIVHLNDKKNKNSYMHMHYDIWSQYNFYYDRLKVFRYLILLRENGYEEVDIYINNKSMFIDASAGHCCHRMMKYLFRIRKNDYCYPQCIYKDVEEMCMPEKYYVDYLRNSYKTLKKDRTYIISHLLNTQSFSSDFIHNIANECRDKKIKNMLKNYLTRKNSLL